MKYFLATTLLLLCFSPLLFAQNETLDAHLDSLDEQFLARPNVALSLNYTSKVAYSGRTEGVKQYGVSPAVAWHIGKGWSLDYAGDFWSATTPKYAFTSIGITKTVDLGDFDAEIGYSRWFSHQAKSVAQSDFSQIVEAKGSYTFSDFNVELYAAGVGGNSKAVFVTPTLSWEKSGRFGNNRQFQWFVNPEVRLDFGNDVLTKIPKKITAVPRKLTKKTFGLINSTLSLSAGVTTQTTHFSLGYVYNVPKNTNGVVYPALGYWEIEVKRGFGW